MIELVLSNTTSFFSGNLENLFKNAKKYGFKYVEILPYRWTTPEQILKLQKKYGIKVAGIHLPIWWSLSLRQIWFQKIGLLEKLFCSIYDFYMGSTVINPGLKIIETLASQNPYLLIHSNVVSEMGSEFEILAKKYYVVVENIPFGQGPQPAFWNPAVIQRELGPRGLKGLVLDTGHIGLSLPHIPNFNLYNVYRQITTEAIHISYGLLHSLPNEHEQQELKSLLSIYAPKYIVIEINPAVSVKKAKLLLEKIIKEAGL